MCLWFEYACKWLWGMKKNALLPRYRDLWAQAMCGIYFSNNKDIVSRYTLGSGGHEEVLRKLTVFA